VVANASTSTPRLEGSRLHPLTLVFESPRLEREFWLDRDRTTIGATRLTLLLGTLIFISFGLLDRHVIPDAANTALLIRFAMVTPIMTLCLAASFHRLGRENPLWLGFIASISAGLAIIAMIVLAAPPGSYLYYAGLLLVSSAIYSFFHLRFTIACAISWGLLVVYEVAAVQAGTMTTILINNSFFLLGTNVVGMIGCYGTERVLRTAYLDRRTVERIAAQDSLTGLLNRRAFFGFADAEVARCRREGAPVSAVMVDIDHFKHINDTYGHAAGDRVLQQVATTLRDELRPSDHVCRYGGEEFLALLPDTTASDSFKVGERLRCAIHEASVNSLEPEPIEVTASVGSATIALDTGETLEQLLRSADDALYRAKRSGRNIVVLAA
jgi:diguanylate cyclase (GGDEF)-like protein